MPTSKIRAARCFRGPCVALATLALGVYGCGEPTQPEPPVATTIVLAPSSLTFSSKGATASLSASVLDQGGAPMAGASVSWITSDPAVATVSATGVVTAVADGSASVTASIGDASADVGVSVEQVVTSVEAAAARSVLTFLGDTVTLTAEARDAGGSEVDGASVTWTSGDETVATVDAAGLVTGLRTGPVEVTATVHDVRGSAEVTVEQHPAVIETVPDALALTAGDTATVLFTVRDGGGSEIVGATPDWATGDAAVGTVTPAGLVTAAGSGTTVVVARVDGPSGSVVDTIPLLVFEDLSVSTVALPTGVEGQPYAPATLVAAGGDGAYTWTLPSGSLPPGMALASGGDLSGTPSATGSFDFTVEVTSGDGQTAQGILSVDVFTELLVTTGALPSAIAGASYGPVPLVATGGTGPYAWSLAPTSAQPPAWFVLAPDGSVSGTPPAEQSLELVVRVASADGQTADRALTLDVYETLAISTESLPAAAEGEDYGPVTLAATGGDGAYAWALDPASPAMPGGLELSADGEITGTPTGPDAPDVVFEVASGDGQTATRTLTVDVVGAPAQLAVIVQPSSGVASGAAFPTQPAVRARDAVGNDLDAAGISVTAAIASGTGALAGTTVAATDAAGIATFTDLAITGDGAHTLDFTAAGLSGASSDPVIVSSGPIVLTDGVPLTGLSGAAGEETFYVFSVPAGAPQLEVVMTGGTGDADLYVREGALPTQSTYDCRPFESDANEVCSFPSPGVGDWFVMIHAFTDYSGVTLAASITSGCTLNSPGDADGDRLPDCVETNTGVFVSELDTGTNPALADTDGDAIDDGDEVLGTEAGLDLPGLGVSPVVPTILIEYDWFDDSGHTHRPTATQIAMVTASFAAQGIEVIHDYGQGPAPFTGGNFIDDPDGNVDGFGSEYYGYKAAHFAANRVGYFHYNMHPHRYNDGGSSGLAEINGDDLITATLSFYGNDLAVAGTIQHELGHNLSLRHGGDVNTNRKPNYGSVMSYNYQFGGVDDDCTPTPDGVLDYSHGTNPSLNENDLDETEGICGGAPGWDWNEDGDESDVGISADINRSWTSTGAPGDGALGMLHDHDDWGNLSYTGILDGDGAPFLAPPELVICPIPPPEILMRE